MPDSHLPEDQALLYVLGELTPARRSAFEAQMARSSDLRALVRELEEGAAALSLASPPRRPPAEAWAHIEKTVRREAQVKESLLPFWIGWWRNGWAVAMLCLVGWLGYAVFVNSHHPLQVSAPQPQPESLVVNSSVTPAPTAKPLPPLTNAQAQLLRVRTEEIGDLHLQIAGLEKETAQLSQLLLQQRALLGETNRIKFFHLSSAAATGGDAAEAPLSPALQRAVFMSIGRELGWLPIESKPVIGAGHIGRANNFNGVDFVDLRPPNNSVANQSPSPSPTPPQTESLPADMPAPTPPPTIPAYVSGDNLIVAVDSSVAPPNSTLTFSVNGEPLFAPTGVQLGDDPMVVTIPFSVGGFGNGWILTVGSVTAGGQTNVTQFFTTPTQ